MKNKFLLFTTLLIICGFIALKGQQSFSVKKDIVVSKGEKQENIITFGGNVLIEGEATNVIAFGGSVRVRGEINDLFSVGSNTTLESTAVVRGDVFIIGGTLDRFPGSMVRGDTIHFKTSEAISDTFKQAFRNIFSISFIPFIMVGKILVFFIWLLISLVVVSIFPAQITFASNQIQKSFAPVTGLGLLSIAIFCASVIFSALLSLILVGIPLLFFFIILGLGIQIFGRVVCFYFLGESLLKAFGRSRILPLVTVIVGLVLLTIARFIPVVGFLLSLGLSVIGWGVIIRTKFGTTENWFARKA
ncbi:MAG: hypothetical protein ACE5LC_09620 [Candidatus Aminicenantales bacterium]